MIQKHLSATLEMRVLAANFPAPEWLPSNLVPAFEFARMAHRNQFRKYTGEPYIVHPLDVTRRLLNAINAVSYDETRWQMLMREMECVLVASLLHDVVEDCGVSLSTIEKEFGFSVAEAVFWVTDTLTSEHGNRATRKRMEAIRLAAAPLSVRCMKLCDMASNTESIVAHDPDFSVVYLQEKAFLMSIIGTTGDENEGLRWLFFHLMGEAQSKLHK